MICVDGESDFLFRSQGANNALFRFLFPSASAKSRNHHRRHHVVSHSALEFFNCIQNSYFFAFSCTILLLFGRTHHRVATAFDNRNHLSNFCMKRKLSKSFSCLFLHSNAAALAGKEWNLFLLLDLNYFFEMTFFLFCHFVWNHQLPW